MPIDDPIEVHLQQVRQDVASKHWLNRFAKLGLTGALAQTLAPLPFAAQIVCGLLSNGPRLEERFVTIAQELNSEMHRLEGSIPNLTYYESEEFGAIISLVIEKLAIIHDKERLRRLGAALARCGEDAFLNDDREQFIRILRDLSLGDLNTLHHQDLKGWKPHTHDIIYPPEVQTSLFRLASFGLVTETWRTQIGVPGTGLTELPPTLKRSYHLSAYGRRFLEFVAIQQETTKPVPSVP